jgi:MFS family permease
MTPPSRSGSRSLIHEPDFLRLWTGQTISAFGTQVTILAIPIVAAVSLRVSPLEFALLGTLEFLPFVLLGLPAGVWIDRMRRRPILIAADIGRAIALLTIPVAAVLNVLTIGQLYLVVFANGCLTVFFDVAYQSHLPAIVEPDQLVDGNAKLELTRTAAQRLGPGLAGLLVGLVTAPIAVVVDAVSYVASAMCLVAIRRPEPPVEQPAGAPDGTKSMRREIGAGLRFVLGHPVLRALAASVALGYLFATIADSILILHLVTERGMSPELIGLAFTFGTLGVFGGALAANRLTARIGVGRVIVLAAVGESLSWLPVAFAPDALLFAGFVATIALLSFFGALWNVNAMSLRQAVTPAGLRGRMNATMRFISWGAIPVGTVLGGILGGAIGLHATIALGAVGHLVVFLPVALSPLPAIRSMPVADEDDPQPRVAAASPDPA